MHSGELSLGSARKHIDRGRGLRLHSTDGVEALRALSAAGGERDGAGTSPSPVCAAVPAAWPSVEIACDPEWPADEPDRDA
eukprot:14928927-Alexandrium_andersonii.AAC.1